MTIVVSRKSILAIIILSILLSGNTFLSHNMAPRILLCCVLALLFSKLAIKKFDRDGQMIIGCYIAWLVFLAINSAMSYSVNESLSLFLIFIVSFFILLVDWNEINMRTFLGIGRIICIFFALSILASVAMPSLIVSISEVIMPDRVSVIQDEISRGIYSGLTGEKAKAAYTMVFGACIEISYYLMQKNKMKRTNYILIALYVVGVMLSGKRMLSAVMFLEIALALHFFRIKGKYIKVLIGAVLAFIAFGVVLITIPQTSNLAARFVEGAADTTSGGRLIFWGYCLKMFVERPLIGYGINTFNIAFGHNVGYIFKGELWNMYAHNIYYELLGEVGSVGVILFIVLLSAVLIKSLKLFKNNNLSDIWKCALWFSIAMQILFIIYGYTGNVLYDKAQLFCYIVAISIYLSANRENKLFELKSNLIEDKQ